MGDQWTMAPPEDPKHDRRKDDKKERGDDPQREKDSKQDDDSKQHAKSNKGAEKAEKKEEHQETPEEKEKKKKVAKRVVIAAGSLVLIALLGAACLMFLRHRRESRDSQARNEKADQGPKVLTAKANKAPGQRDVTLPGDVRPWSQTQLTARVSGYVQELRADKGDLVKQGQEIGRIESPETDRQVDEARARLMASQRLARRVRSLAPAGVVSRQDLDNANAGQRVAKAEVDRTKALQQYEILRAPFDGVITQRYVDLGALVGSAAPVVEVSDPRYLRIQVYAGQDIASFLKIGDQAKVEFPQIPGVQLVAQITRLAGALDSRSRSELVELRLDNKQGLLPGLFAQVTMRVRTRQLPIVPAEALVARSDKLLIPLVNDNKLHFVEIQPGLNDGKTVEIVTGLKGGETVALAIPSELQEGAPVQPTTKEQEEKDKQQQSAQNDKKGDKGDKGDREKGDKKGKQQPAARKPEQQPHR